MELNETLLEKIISEIEGSSYQRIHKRPEIELFELSQDPSLTSNLSGNIGALVVRSMLQQLNIDEHRVLKWRLENKYRQYQVLNYYMPNCMARTLGFSELLNDNNGKEKIKELCEAGFFLKAALGDGTGRANSFDRTGELDDIIRSYERKESDLENWMLQKKLDLKEEFRIHTFNKDIIYGLTYPITGRKSLKKLDAEQFINSILEKLPDTLLYGTLIGWDIGITTTDDFYVIEANFTGFHEEFHRGFQTSGYFGDPYCGSIMCALLNNYFRDKYNISINSIDGNLLLNNPFYQEILFYIALIKEEHLQVLRNETKSATASAIMYLGNHDKKLLIRLLTYLQNINFIKDYYMMTSNTFND